MKRVIGICLMFFIIAIFIVPNFAQADSFNFTVEADKDEIKQGETVTLSLKLSDIDAGELGINTVEGKLSYDEKVFEKVSKSSFTELNNWRITYNDEEKESKGKFVGVLFQIGTKKNQEIGQIKLKVKENIDVSETTIKVTDIATNNGKDLIKDRDKEINLKIAKEDNEGTENNSNDEYIINNIYTINNIYKDDSNNDSNNNPNNSIIGKIKETAKNIDLSKLPETGTGRMIIYVIIIVLLIIINLLISYVTTGKKKKKKKIIKK